MSSTLIDSAKPECAECHSPIICSVAFCKCDRDVCHRCLHEVRTCRVCSISNPVFNMGWVNDTCNECHTIHANQPHHNCNNCKKDYTCDIQSCYCDGKQCHSCIFEIHTCTGCNVPKNVMFTLWLMKSVMSVILKCNINYKL